MRHKTNIVEGLLALVSAQTAIESRDDLEDDFGGDEDRFARRGVGGGQGV